LTRLDGATSGDIFDRIVRSTSSLHSRRLGPVAPGLRRLRHVQPRRRHRRRSRGQPEAFENRSGRFRWMDGGKHDEPTLAARTLQNLGLPQSGRDIATRRSQPRMATIRGNTTTGWRVAGAASTTPRTGIGHHPTRALTLGQCGHTL
jgi:hypothetical protein